MFLDIMSTSHLLRKQAIFCIKLTPLTLLLYDAGRAEERVAKLVDSPDKPESEASYKLDEGGWADV